MKPVQPHLRAEWLVLVSCVMLNQTSRKQVERVLPTFIKRWPDASSLLSAQENDVAEVIKSLGLSSRRAHLLMKMAERYVSGSWTHASELPGVGKYVSRAWEIFCLGELGASPPSDHALVKHHAWARKNCYDTSIRIAASDETKDGNP